MLVQHHGPHAGFQLRVQHVAPIGPTSERGRQPGPHDGGTQGLEEAVELRGPSVGVAVVRGRRGGHGGDRVRRASSHHLQREPPGREQRVEPAGGDIHVEVRLHRPAPRLSQAAPQALVGEEGLQRRGYPGAVTLGS